VAQKVQGSVVTQTMLHGLTTHPQIANFLQCACTKNYDRWLAVWRNYCNSDKLLTFWATRRFWAVLYHCMRLRTRQSIVNIMLNFY